VEVGEMKKGIVVLLAAALTCVGAAAATNLYAEHARAGSYANNPGNVSGGDNFKKLWDNCDRICQNLSRTYTAYDGEWWDYDNQYHRTWPYMFFKFDKPGGFSGGTCKWRIKQEGGSDVKVYRWNPNTEVWVPESENDGGSNPPVLEFSIGSGSNYWNEDGKCYIMATSDAYSPDWYLSCDLCKISY
jgi:hypothetical protein